VDKEKAVHAAAGLRAAMKGLGTDEQALVDIICPASNKQLQEIIAQYTHTINRDLLKDIKSECSGKFEDVLINLLTDKIAFDAKLVRDAVKGLGTDEAVLNEVLCTRTPGELKAIGAAFHLMYGKNMQKEIEEDVSGNLKKVYVAMLTHERKERRGSEEEVAAAVDALYQAGEGRLGTSEAVFVKMFTEEGRHFLDQVYWAYAKKHGKALDAVVEAEFSGNLKKCLIALVCPLDQYYCNVLHAAMEGAGTNDKVLMRVIVTQKERWLIPAAKRYLEQHKKTLEVAVKSETSGDYRKSLVSTVTHWGAVA